MIVSTSVHQEPFPSLWMHFSPESDLDITPRAGTATFEELRTTPVLVELLPQSGRPSMEKLHPDLVALAAILVCGPLKVGQIKLSRKPSAALTKATKQHFGIEIHAPGAAAEPRTGGPYPGLAFSGGVDSCAALLMLPRSTASVFMHRFSLEGGSRGLYNPSAALASVKAIQESGYRAATLRSNVETIRTPVGFPVDWSNALPLVVNADTLGLSSIAFGTVLESASSLGKYEYSQLGGRTIYSRWAPIFSIAGLDISLPVASMSEVLTSRIVLEKGAFMQPQSCVRGTPGSPCRRCFKCFRKSLTEWALYGTPRPSGEIESALASKEVNARLRQSPIHHEVGIAWAAMKIESDIPALRALRARAEAIAATAGGLDFMERPYWPNVNEFVPTSIRSTVSQRLEDEFGKARSTDTDRVEAWDVRPAISSPKYLDGLSATNHALDHLT